MSIIICLMSCFMLFIAVSLMPIDFIYVVALICVLGGLALAGIKLTNGNNPSKREEATTYAFVLIGAGMLLGSSTFILKFAINLL